MSMAVFDRRLQVLLPRPQWEGLEDEAARSGQTVSQIVRDAIDLRLKDSLGASRAAATRLLALPPPDGPEPSWADTKNALEDEAARRWGT
jgi:hypothetical protein